MLLYISVGSAGPEVVALKSDCNVIALSLFALVAAAVRVDAAVPEVRGTWLTTTGPDHIRSGLNTEMVFADLRQIGLNTAYTETWKNGYTNFPSQTLQAIIRTTDRNPTIGATRDLVQETLIQAHRQGMAYYGWFEYGAIAQFVGSGGTPSNPLANFMKARGWLLENQAGQYADGSNGGFAYMNLAVPEVRELLIGVTLEAVNRYDLDGIQFDDHVGWPANFGFDSTTLGLYVSETGNSEPTSPADSQFSLWRQQKVTSFVQELYAAAKTARPEIEFSISPSITGFSTTNYNANWPQWESQGIFDEFAVQMYRDNASSFNSIVDAQVDPFQPDALDKLVFGLRINGSGAATPVADLQAMILRSRAEGAAGHSLWYSNGVRDLYDDELTSLYDAAALGQAPNPNFPADHRPEPVLAVPAGAGIWTADVATAGRYRLVAKFGSYWTEYNVAELSAGHVQFVIPDATQIELLVDRRTATSFLGDFDGDANISGRDFLMWQRGYGQSSGAIVAHGDANADGRTDASDLRRWRQNYGRSTAPATLAGIKTPEPDSIVLLLLAMCLTCFRTVRRSFG